MKVLLAWDDAREAELLALYLNTADNETTLCPTPATARAHLRDDQWDVVFLAQTFPTADDGYTLFRQVLQELPNVPVLLGCRPSEMIGLPRFLTHGLRFYLIRDPQGDFIFLALSSLESAVAAAQAEEVR